MRNWAVGVVSAAAVVAGLVVVQSGISGSTLPILPHRSSAAAADGPDLPAPTEAGAPPPAAGAVRPVPATRAAVAVRPAPAQHHPAARPERPAKEPKGEDDGKHSGKDGKSGSDKSAKSGKD